LAVKKEVDTIIVTPGAGDVPLLFENAFVSLIFQYHSYGLAAMNKQTIPLVQNPDKNAAIGVLASVMAGMALSQYKDYMNGVDDQDQSWLQYLWEALGETGSLSTIYEFYSYAQMANDMNPSIAGPTATAFTDADKAARGFFGAGDMTDYQRRAAGRLVPFMSLARFLGNLPGGAAELLNLNEGSR